MGRGHRQERLGEEIKKIISGLILRELEGSKAFGNGKHNGC